MINLESKYWDCEYNLNELIVFNNRKCLLNPNYEKLILLIVHLLEYSVF